MKLEVGMYVRTDLGEIGKITSVAKDDIFGDGKITFYNSEPFLKGSEIKASHNIIDLIEVGDYVNGIPVEDITKFKDGTWCITFDEWRWIDNNINAIETISTKEQYEIFSYKVGD